MGTLGPQTSSPMHARGAEGKPAQGATKIVARTKVWGGMGQGDRVTRASRRKEATNDCKRETASTARGLMLKTGTTEGKGQEQEQERLRRRDWQSCASACEVGRVLGVPAGA